VRDAALAVEHAHSKGIIHRDLKPGNLMRDTTGRVMVMDFGLARRVAGASSLSMSGMAIGTPAYISPEQARGIPNVDARADVYSLGATLYALVTGRPPFVSPDVAQLLACAIESDPLRPSRLVPSIPVDLETIILKTLEKDPSRRYLTAEALAADLTRWLDGDPILARPTSIAYVAWKRVRKRPVTVALVSLLSAALAVALVVAMNRYRVAVAALSEAEGHRAVAVRKAADLERELESKERRRRAMDALRPATDVLSLWEFTRGILRTGDDKLAREAIDEALRHDPTYGQAWIEEGRLRWKLGIHGGAVEAFDKAALDPPCAASAVYYRARLRLLHYLLTRPLPELRLSGSEFVIERGRGPETDELRAVREAAVVDLAGCTRLFPAGDPRTVYVKGLLALVHASGPAQHVAAAESIRPALESMRVPRWEGSLVRAIAFIDAGEFRSALEAMSDSSMRGGGNEPTVTLLIGMCAWAESLRRTAAGEPGEGLLNEALQALDESIRVQPDSTRALYYRALANRTRGDRTASRRDLDRAITLDPENQGCRVARGVLRYETGDPTGAIEDYSAVLRLQPGLAAVWSNRAQAKRALRDLAGAIEDLDKAIELDAAQPGPWVNRSAAKRAKGDLDGAVGDASRAIQLDANHAGAWLNRGNAKVDQRDYAGAVADWERFVALAPAHPYAPQVRIDIDKARALMKEEDK
jgi:tetratricopeptide (TPR) repeat protein